MDSKDGLRNLGADTPSSAELCSLFIEVSLKIAFEKRFPGKSCLCSTPLTMAFRPFFAELESQSCMSLVNMAVVPRGCQLGP